LMRTKDYESYGTVFNRCARAVTLGL
jgi:hypothetical protein